MQRAVLRNTLDALLRLAHPAMPFITEAIFERLRLIDVGDAPFVTLEPARKGDLLATAGWPRVAEGARDEKAEAHFARLQSLVTAIREVKAQHQVNPKRRIVLHAEKSILEAIEPVSAAVHTVAGLERATVDAPTGASVAFRFESMELRLSNLADAVDAGAEKTRLQRQVTDLEKSITTLSGRLANPGYADRAPAAMVQQTRDQITKAQADLAAAREGLARLGG